ncbi:LOW QUALITY PROTEIN: glycerol-3-phosphate dehydrogenase [NAD(+)], cytoplasmic-like [Babylonia areolata]|uniref:LOW QUALITY PROTEIN: glycerol-3-phosphate dehydrogenase [NAD(+)], cytoplasmic-like n=1 Tax=Babylonia areolata TaxID=304850 RepID=UPI003FD0E40B
MMAGMVWRRLQSGLLIGTSRLTMTAGMVWRRLQSSLIGTRVTSLVTHSGYYHPVSFLRSRRLCTVRTNMAKKSVCIVGSGNWGSAIAKIIGNNVQDSGQFEKEVRMWMYEEKVDGRNLTEIVNTEHENVKYLPGIKLPTNVVAIPDVKEACKDADILVFVLPHQFVDKTCAAMRDHVKKEAVAISLIKGFALTDSGIKLVSDIISESLNKMPCAVLMGANLAGEVASELFCESTIGCKDENMGQLFKTLFSTPYFRCTVVGDASTVECCGALKNVVGIGAGIVDGLKSGANTKAAVIRLGLMEMVKFCEVFMSGAGTKVETFFESCGVADLVATCHGGRNRMLGEQVVKTSKTIHELEKEILRGQSFQGPLVAKEIYEMLEKKNMLQRFPLFVAVHRICKRELEPKELIECLKEHPEHMQEALWQNRFGV